MVGVKISCGNVARELGGFGGISSDSLSMSHGGVGSDLGSREVMLTVSREGMISDEVVGCR